LTEDPDYIGQTYRAIGHYVVEFGLLVFVVRDQLAMHLSGDRPDPLPYIVMGEMTARPLANAFFGGCRRAAMVNDPDRQTFTGDDRAVENVLIAETTQQIEFRNDLAHGDWAVNAHRFARTQPGVSELLRLRPNRKDGSHVETIHVSIKDLEDRCVALEALANRLHEYAMICFGDARWEGLAPSDIFAVASKVITRDGPKAAQIKPPDTFRL
jgi:hypothetical protein